MLRQGFSSPDKRHRHKIETSHFHPLFHKIPLPHFYPSLIHNNCFCSISHLVNRFRCPKGWKRLGGSCYLLSSTLSSTTEVNATCYRSYSNQSHLVHINNPIEFFYTAHVLLRENLTSLMIEIDPSLLTGELSRQTLVSSLASLDHHLLYRQENHGSTHG